MDPSTGTLWRALRYSKSFPSSSATSSEYKPQNTVSKFWGVEHGSKLTNPPSNCDTVSASEPIVVSVMAKTFRPGKHAGWHSLQLWVGPVYSSLEMSPLTDFLIFLILFWLLLQLSHEFWANFSPPNSNPCWPKWMARFPGSRNDPEYSSQPVINKHLTCLEAWASAILQIRLTTWRISKTWGNTYYRRVKPVRIFILSDVWHSLIFSGACQRSDFLQRFLFQVRIRFWSGLGRMRSRNESFTHSWDGMCWNSIVNNDNHK